MQKSLQGTSQFINFDGSMEQSMIGSSQKIPIQNASLINRQQRQRDMKALKNISAGNKTNLVSSRSLDHNEDDEQNQFLNVGKWNKSKNSDAKKITQSQISQKQKLVSRKQQKAIVQQIKPSSKWEKKKSNTQLSKNSNNIQVSDACKIEPKKTQTVLKRPQTDKNCIDVNKSKQIKQQIETQDHIQDQSVQNVQQDEQEVQQEQQEQQDEDEQQQDEEQEQDEQESQEQQQQEESDEQQQDQQQQIDQQQPAQQQQIEDKFANNASKQHSAQSSEAYQTQILNSSGIRTNPKPSKWNKKKAPLDTMTKYEDKQESQDKKGNQKPYHSRLVETQFDKNAQNELEQPNNQSYKIEQWAKIQKVLLRIKLMLG